MNFRFPLPDVRDPKSKKIVFRLQPGVVTDNGASPWFSFIPMGTPGQMLKFAFDTGTTHSWVTSIRCTTNACLMHQRFSPNDSDSFNQITNPRTPTTIDFGAWGEMKSYLGRDFIDLKRGLSSEKIAPCRQLMTLYLSESYQGNQFEDLVWDGGISLPRNNPASTNSANHTDSDQLLTLLKQSGLIEKEMVSFWYNGFTKEGQCIIGAVNTRKFDPSSVNFVPVVPLPAPNDCLWSVKLDDLDCGGLSLFKEKINFVLDTGSSRFKGDEGYIQKIKCAVTRNGELPGVIKTDRPDFDEYPDLTFSINGQNYVLQPSQYFMEVAPGVWELAFHPMDGLEGVLLVGSLFLETVYSIFYYNTGDSREPQVVGLARQLF